MINYLMYMAKVRELEEYPEQLRDVYALYLQAGNCGGATCPICTPYPSATHFAEIVSGVIGENTCVACAICNRPEWQEESDADVDGNIACDNCRADFTSCDGCEEWSIRRRWLCEVAGNYYCDTCRDDRCSFCDGCDMWYLDEDSDDHDHDSWCECSPQKLNFEILANSHGVLQQDERLLVELPGGAITIQAVNAAIDLIWVEQFSSLFAEWERARYIDPHAPMPAGLVDYSQFSAAVMSLEPVWQAKRGNYTRRLSALLFKDLGVKLKEGLLSKVGSTIRSHTSMKNAWHIELTRDLNQPAEAFFNEGSCWWGGENTSLCALKHWGGLGIRSYSTEDIDRCFPSGRAWVQPLNENLEPTQDVFGAHAYIVYNGYGELAGYTAARLVAYLTSRTYRKISLGISYQYVNSGGYLVADQATCDSTGTISIHNLQPHEAVAA